MTKAEKIGGELFSNAEMYCSHLLKIQTKEGEMESLEYNEPQKRLHEMVEEMQRKGKPVRIICLKARQQGISTYIQSQIFKQVATRKHQSGLVIAHDQDSSEGLYQMSQRFYENMPPMISFDDGSKFRPKPNKKFSNRKELVFSDLQSSLRVATAGSGDSAGRSGTNQVMHCSEVAFWGEGAKRVMLALLQALPDSSNSMAFIESTANGIGGYFYDLWVSAIEGKNEWLTLFLPWFASKEYSSKFYDEEEKQEFVDKMDEEEKALRKEFSLSLEQLNWRRKTIANKCNGDLSMFRQEYPASWQEAFQASGRPFFNLESLIPLQTAAKAGDRGMLFHNKVQKKWEWQEHSGGWVEIWEHPKPYGCYAIGADVAEGLSGGDYSAAVVWDRDTGKQVAQWHGHIAPDAFGVELNSLGQYYNMAWIAPEINNHGISTVKSLEDKGYPRIYHRRTSNEVDERNAKEGKKIGWKTTSSTRPMMLDHLNQSIRQGECVPRSAKLVNECFTFVRNNKGRPEAQVGCHDDLVVAGAIGLMVHQHCPMSRPISSQEKVKRKIKREKLLSEMTRYDTTGY